MIRRTPPTLLLLTLLTSIGGSATGCATADLRPDALARANRSSADAEQRGRALLDAAAKKHGLDAWKTHRYTRFTIRDSWPHWLTRTFGMPWDENHMTIRVTLLTGKDTGRADFLQGDRKGTAWGLQQWKTYEVNRKGEVTFRKNRDAWFWIPTVEYFFELPFRIREGGTITHLDVKKRGGKTYDRVFVTWGGYRLNDEMDQYVVWVNRETGMIDLAEFTARDVFDFAVGVVFYKNFSTVQGVQVPGEIMIREGMEEDVLHTMVVRDVSFPESPGANVNLIPDPSKRAKKSDEGE